MKILNRVINSLKEKLFHLFFNRSFFRNWSLDYYRTIHSFKTAFACLLGVGLAHYYAWPSGQWIPITIMVVMSAQSHFGAALQKAYMRFLGTIAGVLIVILSLLIFKNNYFAIFPIVFFSCLIFTYVACGGGNISYAGTLGGVTVILTLTSIHASIEQTIARGLYITIGIVIALFVSRFIFPLHASDKLRLSITKNLYNLRKLYAATIQNPPSQQASTLNANLEKKITYRLSAQPKLIEEAATGSLYFNNYKKDLYIQVVASERKIYRLIYFMQKNIYENLSIQNLMSNIDPLENLHIFIENSLTDLAENLENFTLPQNTINFPNLLNEIAQITAQLTPEQDVQKLLGEHSFLFFVEQIIKEIQFLYTLIEQINTTVANHKKVQER